MPTRDHALELAQLGWQVLPLRGKVPVTRRGVHDATTDRQQVAAWWPTGADHNIGARVPAGLVVLDFDPQNNGSVAELEAVLHQPLPQTLIVHSGRGNGSQHRYYRHPGGHLSSTRLPQGIDVKTATGYCVMPPSVHPVTGNPYRWEQHEPSELPAALLALLRPPPTPLPHEARPDRQQSSDRANQLVRFVAQLPEGKRNDGLYWAACRALDNQAPPGVLEQLVAAAQHAGITETEARRTLASATRGQHRS